MRKVIVDWMSARKPASKPLKKVEKSPVDVTVVEEKKSLPSSTCNSLSPKPHSVSAPSALRHHEQLLQSNLSLNASCSSDASTDSFHSRASSGRLIRPNSVGSRRKPYASKPRNIVSDGSHQQKRCPWVTPNTDPYYVLSMMKSGEFLYMMTRNCLSCLCFPVHCLN